MLMSTIVSLAGRGFEGDEFRGSAAMAIERLLDRQIDIDESVVELYKRWLFAPRPQVEDDADATPGEGNKGVEQVARRLNRDGAAGRTARDVKVAAVLHGEADKSVLSDAAYSARFKVAANPNLPLIRDLKKAGVEVFVCGQSLHELGFKAEEVAKEVPVADSALLVLVNKQNDGYAYIPARQDCQR